MLLLNNQESKRLKENSEHTQFWKQWGSYLSERQWGTVREDYSEHGNAWSYFTHDHARSRAYRWGEDGLAGISDNEQNLCFAIALWNGKDPILKERLFGLDGEEGNHGEDVKELYYYLDNTPTHSYMKYLYKYPQSEFPYNALVSENRNRGKYDREFEILDSGCFDDKRYFDIFVEYAKNTPRDISIRITVINRGDETAHIDVLPSLWFRNTWSFGSNKKKPEIKLMTGCDSTSLEASHESLGTYYLYYEQPNRVLFTENETNYEKLFQIKNDNQYVKDYFHDQIINPKESLEQKSQGTKAAVQFSHEIAPKESRVILMRLVEHTLDKFDKIECDQLIEKQKKEANIFYKALGQNKLHPDIGTVYRQAFAGLLWNKQFYNYEVETWLKGDQENEPHHDSRINGRNSEWKHLFNRDVISMPDKWEYPWYATWDLAFHCIPLASIDADYAKKQLLLFLREWYMHPNGQLPAYEWALSDVNPPVHAWACYKVYTIEKENTGKGDIEFLKRVFHKLLLNFTWWTNRMDADGMNVFQGGFLGLDNIGIFDRSKPIPTGGHLEQADGTSWMAMYSLNMMTIALELACEDSSYEDMASKFFEHFVYISEAFNNFGHEHHIDLWDEEDGFFYDAIHYENNHIQKLKVRSIVGLVPLFAVVTFDLAYIEQFKGFTKRLNWFRNNRASLGKHVIIEEGEGKDKILFSLVNKDRLVRITDKLLDETEFLSPFGIRSLSKFHEKSPFVLEYNNESYCINYKPGESDSSLFGGNSNWRGPIWMPINYLIIDSLRMNYQYYGDDLKVPFPNESDTLCSLNEVADGLAERLISIFRTNRNGDRAVNDGAEIYRKDRHFKDLVLFYEYFHGCEGYGLGASHQTGWTALIADLIKNIG
ncbi:MAG: glucosidase [Bacillota bacterium]|nr:glucosidase [Bacillota bacterium]